MIFSATGLPSICEGWKVQLLNASVPSALTCGTSSARSGFFLGVPFVRGGSVAAWGDLRQRDFGTRAQYCGGARHLLCGGHSFELEIRLYQPIVLSTLITVCLIAATWLLAETS